MRECEMLQMRMHASETVRCCRCTRMHPELCLLYRSVRTTIAHSCGNGGMPQAFAALEQLGAPLRIPRDDELSSKWDYTSKRALAEEFMAGQAVTHQVSVL